ncbi:TrmH family RNA methyltransferase [Tenacibaculum finnmarkense genomovar finnmarkense]|uniref:TrmH family RNA methyltransferase n=1 Tax=Tenacibaculum finnmarkense genomovar finnmarkense TaxID=1458503 RepID=A0AAP1RF93_9FLAO|nr:TrmH family RNA methyltransferase [Tenacibaculum finnmarkense]MBE7633951.1 TrmH family RNA methyltransferase [Tenacibaculum finnmarkense genomovar ulcerans]MBE7645554.1 TrmH family RNA methyltransferase [Tenacibaculum finnmarkense genomovar ulcerans]MBE7647619.1 TrmH family RNA methyltransferase [Tenacibaculum finnmarkense genomovar ulcerans]MBE7652871.1 TrmH family RNA methyltransferase [Tenacibaculum finnmarkense genomovar finnmarkense]MBE7659909.1 TrmH family RNA methyltransferase [Tenac
MKQLTHYDIENKQQTFPITIVCDAIRTPENIGMCFRIAESFGVQKIFLHQSSPSIQNRNVKRTARNTIAQIEHEIYDDFNQVIKQLKAEGNTIIGIEVADKSVALQNFDFTSEEKIVLLLGSERNGIENINNVDATVAIPMFGRNSSMNVIHSLSIALYETTNQLNKIK